MNPFIILVHLCLHEARGNAGEGGRSDLPLRQSHTAAAVGVEELPDHRSKSGGKYMKS